MATRDFERTQEIRNLRFQEHMTLREIGNIYGLTRERVRQILGDTGGHKVAHVAKAPVKLSKEQRFWNKVDIRGESDCWEWKGFKLPSGYGRKMYQSEEKYAHRVAYIITFGEIPQGFCVCHKCDNPSCCNPNHLFLGTAADNARDRSEKGRTAPGKLNQEQADQIREMYKSGKYTQSAIAKMYSVTFQTIFNITTGRTYNNAPASTDGREQE